MAIADAGRILVCLRYGIGDVVMQWPALAALRAASPSAHITAVGAEPAIELLADGRHADRVLSVHSFGLGHWGDAGDEGRRAAIVRWLKDERFDAVLDPSHAAMGFGAAVWATDHPAIYDTGAGQQDRELARARGGTAAVNAAVQSGWGLDLPIDAAPRLSLGPEEQAFAAEFLARHGLALRSPLAVSPVASSPLKRWPVERLARLAAELSGDVPVLLFAVDDNSLLTSWQTAVGTLPWITVPRLHLRLTAALLQQCRLLVCNDTGLMHLSAAVGTPAAAVFGPTSAEIYGPPLASAAAAASPCPHRRQDAFGPPSCVVMGQCLLGQRSCIDQVTEEEVLARAVAAETTKRTGGGA